MTYLKLSEEDAAPRPLNDGKQGLVCHLTHEPKGIEFLMLATAGLLLLQVGQDLGLYLGLIWFTLQELHDKVGKAGRGATLVGVHVRVAHEGLRGAGVWVRVLGLDGAALEVAVSLVALKAAVGRHSHADGGGDEGAAVIVCGGQGSMA